MSKIYSEKDRLQIIFDLVTEWKCKKNKYINANKNSSLFSLCPCGIKVYPNYDKIAGWNRSLSG